MRAMFPFPTRRVARIAAVALLVGVATCVDDRVPTESDGVMPDSAAGAALVSVPITHTLLTQGTNINNQRVYTTAPIAPAPNTLITIAVLGHNSSNAPPSPTVTGGGMATWTEVASIALDGATPLKRMTVFRAMSAAPGSGPLTITFSATVSNSQWIVSQWDGVDVSGTNGSGAIVQTGSTRADGSNGLTVTLAPFADANNVAFGVFGLRTSASGVVTPGAGFTEIAEQPSGESTPAALQAQWGVNDPTIDATWASLNAGALGVEIKAASGGGGGPGGVSPTLSSVEVSDGVIGAGAGVSTITVTVKHANGDPVSGATVVLSATGTGNTLTQPAGPTNEAGVAIGTIRSTVAETKTISATADGVGITQTAQVTVTPGPVSADSSTITADPTMIASGTGQSTITVTARDAFRNPISGATVVLTATGSGSALVQPGPTDANGVATGTYSSDMDGNETISARINGTLITQTATVEVMVHAPANISHTLLTAGNNAANQKVYATASIAPVPNALVTVAVLMRRSGGALSPTVTGGGMAAWDLVTSLDFDTQGSPTKRLLLFRAMSATPGSGPLTITFPSSVSNAQWIVSQWTGVETGGVNGAGAIGQIGTARSDAATSLTSALTPFSSITNVAYGVVGVARNGPIVTPGPGFTEIAELSSGETSALQAEWATNVPTVQASWTTSTKAGLLAVELRAGSMGSPAVVSVDVAPPAATIAVSGTVQLTATAQNAEGEPLPGYTAIWQTDAPGVATVTTEGLVRGVSPGSATITATIEGHSATSSITVTANTAPVASVEVTPASSTIPVGGTVQLTATPKDAAGQPLTGRVVTWSSSATGVATVSGSGLVAGQGEGAATITATSETVDGTAQVTVTGGGNTSLVGQWSSVIAAPTILIHTHLLPDGRVLIFGRNGAPQVWNPATGAFTAVPSPSLLFCAGHDWLPDGRLLVTGGHISSSRGLPNTNIFNHRTTSWEVGPVMAQGRWYPTNTMLGNGEVLTMSGEDESGTVVGVPEVWDGAAWRRLTTADLSLPNYPRTFLAPDGRVFYAGSQQQTRFLDVTGTGSWTLGPQRRFGGRSYGAAVMFEPGKIMYVGGANPPTNTAEIIDLNQPSPEWAYTGSLARARWNLNATILPTGEVLVTGGVSGDRSNPANAVNTTELWDPATGTWTTMAPSASLLRGYHSSSLLLPDGRVLHGGGGGGGGTIDNFNYELYSPPYLFRGPRPEITGATPEFVAYGQQLFVGTPDGATITKVTFIRHGSTTHAFDQAQRLVPLSFTVVPGGLSITLPASSIVAPRGPYMLFLVNSSGVPSVARSVILQ